MNWITTDVLLCVWERCIRIAPPHVRYLAAFLAVVLLALCALCPSQALARPLAVSARPLGAGTSKTYQPPVVAAAVRISHHLIFVGDSLTEGAFALDAAHSYAVLTASALHVSYSVQSQYGVTAVFTASKMQEDSGLAVPADAQDAVIELGTNDVVASGETLAQFRTAYDYILTRVHHDAPQAKFVCLGTWRDPAQGGSYDAIIQSDCASLVGGAYVALGNFYLNSSYHGPAGRVTFLGTGDNFHPNNAGHQAISTALLAALPS